MRGWLRNELSLAVYLDAEGDPYWADAYAPGGTPALPPPPTTSPTARPCVATVVDELAFAATGAERRLGVRLVRGRPLRTPAGFAQAPAPAAKAAMAAEPPTATPEQPAATAEHPAAPLASEGTATP